jgi:hypothetical protein
MLAEELHVSPGTISRVLNDLSKKGYIKKSFQKSGKQYVASRYFIALPEVLINQLKQTPDRNISAVKTPEDHVENKTALKEVEQSIVKDGTSCQLKPRVKTESPYDQPRAQSMISSDHTNSNIYNNKNNNNTQEIASSEKSVVVDIGSKLSNAKRELNQLFENQSNISSQEFYVKSRRKMAEVTFLENQLCLYRKKTAITPKKAVKDFTKAPGQRAINQIQLLRIREAVQTKKASSDEVSELTNEIAFAIRFGRLTKSYETGREMSVNHSINVALKLLRENRWERPLEMSCN